MSLCLIYDDSPMPWGPFSMPTYFYRAAAKLVRTGTKVLHAQTQENLSQGRASVLTGDGRYWQKDEMAPSLYVYLDDSQHFEPIHPSLHPCAVYVTDTHAGGYEQRLRRAEKADSVFACHLSGVEKLSLDLQREVHWLPLACDPVRHAEGAQPPDHRTKEVVFVGNFGTTSTGEFGRRSEWLEAAGRICQEIGISFSMSERYADNAFDPYKRALVALNFPCNHDLNMRAFEAIAGGAFLLTQPVEKDSMDKIGLMRSIHFDVFEDTDDLKVCLQMIMDSARVKSEYAALARSIILDRHTYDHRLKQILETCGIDDAC